VELLSGLSQSLIIATCNMDFAASVADYAVLMDEGRIIAQGWAADVMGDSQLMRGHGLEVPRRFS